MSYDSAVSLLRVSWKTVIRKSGRREKSARFDRISEKRSGRPSRCASPPLFGGQGRTQASTRENRCLLARRLMSQASARLTGRPVSAHRFTFRTFMSRADAARKRRAKSRVLPRPTWPRRRSDGTPVDGRSPKRRASSSLHCTNTRV